MKDLAREILAYALQNALEYGKADAGRVLPKLFQHGLKKEGIGKIMPVIAEAVKKANSLSRERLEEDFRKLEKFVKVHEEKEKNLPEIDVKGLGKVVTRMAPEPSKHAHLGHALTFLINYLYAKKYKGKCLLRFEDTNPEKVSGEYVKSIIDDLGDYLGIKYDGIRYVSDDMPLLYDYAEKLVKSGDAYVCFCKREEMQDLRHKGIECGCRHLSLKIHAERWKLFVKGEYEEGHAVLRLKGNMQSQNHVMRDPALFRRLNAKHYRHGSKYKVWPLYDFYNPIEDSLMGVSLILRSNEFDMRVELQDKIKELLGMKKQKIIQYGRFNVREFTTKGREIRELIESGELMGWDDPRLITLKSLRRRGIVREAFYELVKQIGLSKHEVNLEFDMIAAINRKIIDSTSERHYFVSSPVKINISNMGALPKEVDVPVHPEKKEVRKVKVGKDIFVSGDDYLRLEGKEVRLLHLCNLRLKEKARVISLENKNLPKIQWVSEGVKAMVLMPDGSWLDGLADSHASKLKIGDVVQFERFGFARYDCKDAKKKGLRFWFAHK